MRLFSLVIALAVLAGCSKPAETNNVPASAKPAAAAAEAGPKKGIDRSHKGQPAPAATFNNPDGGEIRLADFKGVPVLVNLWATWCGPSVMELASRVRLAQAHAVDGELGVVAISQDSAPHKSVVAFLNYHKIRELGAYQDPDMSLAGALGPDVVLPTSILIDAEGREVWRYVGDLDWTSPEAARLLAEARPGGKD
jgi:thiol-disulfide isomerase/thioredoxin